MNVIYIKTIKDFLEDIDESSYISEMCDGTHKYGLSTSESEKTSWDNNSRAIAKLLSDAKLPNDVYIGFEYLVPVGGRIDCVILGHGKDGKANMLHIELKQWSNDNVTPFCNTNNAISFSLDVVVEGYRNGTHVEAHPAEQAREYQNHLLNYLSVFNNGDEGVNLFGCAYCYNYSSNNDNCTLLNQEFQDTVLRRIPLYCEDQKDKFVENLKNLFSEGNGSAVFEKIAGCRCEPTQRLCDVARDMFDGNNAQEIFALIGNQLNAYQSILSAIEKTDKENEKTVIIVKGGPGTGKSVIALRLISELAKTGRYNNLYYSTRSSSLRNGLKTILRGVHYTDNSERSAEGLIKNNIDFRPNGYEQNSIDALIVDEAHRITNAANDQTDRDKRKQTHLTQIMAMLYTARVSVFFIDDHQSIKGEEIGTSINIRNAAENYYARIQQENKTYLEEEYPKLKQKIERKSEILNKYKDEGNESKITDLEREIKSLNGELECGKLWVEDVKDATNLKINIIEIELKDQFRCNGSNNYINWLDQLLYKTNRDQEIIKLDTNTYEFGVFDSPQALYEKIRSLDDYARDADRIARELGENFSYTEIYNQTRENIYRQRARLATGYCWPWKERTQDNGDLPYEVTIPEHNFAMPWETKARPQGDYVKKYARNADLWCNQNEGVNQIGCIYSLQGWETDYIGIIIGPDLKYDKENDCLRSDNTVITHSVPRGDIEQHNILIKNIYRVLLTRGKKGCFVFCCDPEVGDYFRRYIE